MPDITITLSDDDYARLVEKAKRKMETPEQTAHTILRTTLHFFDAAGGEQQWTSKDAEIQVRWARG